MIDVPYIDKFDVYKPPRGKVYQWVTTHMNGEPANSIQLKHFAKVGWKPVPPRRHPDAPRIRGKIIVDGQMLVEMPRKKWLKLTGKDYNDAKKLLAEYDQILGREEGQKFHIMPDTWVVSRPYEGAGPDPIDVLVEIVIRCPAGLADVAAAMKLSVSEYMRRKMVMYSQRNGVFGLLLPLKGNELAARSQAQMMPLEFIEDANLNVERAR